MNGVVTNIASAYGGDVYVLTIEVRKEIRPGKIVRTRVETTLDEIESKKRLAAVHALHLGPIEIRQGSPPTFTDEIEVLQERLRSLEAVE